MEKLKKEENLKNNKRFEINKKEVNMVRLVSIPKEDLESLELTLETLQDKEVMEQLEKSEKDIEEERVRSIDEFIEELKKTQ